MVNIFSVLLFGFIFNTNGKNEIHIQKELSNMDKLLKSGKFEKGFIVDKGDTISVDILKFNRRKKVNAYLFCVVKDITDSIKVFTASQIDGYGIGNEIFRTQIYGESHFFIQQIKTGRAVLYERDVIPSDSRFLYYIKLPNYDKFFIICPNEQNVDATIIPPDSKSAGVLQINSKNIPEKFKLFISNYLGDCLAVRNMVQADFYTINDIPMIIERYNECK